MKVPQIDYLEGDCFLVPLRDGGHARGVVVRLNGEGVVFGYFFGPRFVRVEQAIVDAFLKPENAVLAGRFGDPGLLKGTWPVFGRIPNWDSCRWVLPKFVRREDSRILVARYTETLSFVGEEELPSPVKPTGLPEDGLMGYGFVEIKLTKLLAQPAASV